MVTRTGIGGAMRSKDTVREGGIEREERIEDTESDTEVVTELGGRGVVDIGEDSFGGKLSFK